MPGSNDVDEGVLSLELQSEAGEQAARLQFDGAVSSAEIQATMAKLWQEEAETTVRLDALVASQHVLKHDLSRLDILRANLGSQAVSTRSISKTSLAQAAATAKRLSTAVNQLDLEQARVKDTLNVVEQVSELKTCMLGVLGSMGAAQDWEAAAGYLHRASRIPLHVVNGSFAEEIVPTAEVPEPPNITLAQAAESLCGLFLREFEHAAKENNGPRVTRFFKLFPLIGKPEVGLDVYGRYACQGVAARARSNLNAGTAGSQNTEGFFYANALTKLFEHVAQIVEHHGGLVARHYGEGRMVRILERLQMEVDVQGGIIIDTWSDERSLDRKLTDIKSYAFTFLVQSFLPAAPAPTGTPRAGSPMRRDAPGENMTQSEQSVDTKMHDALLSEMTVMIARWSLYCRFMALKFKLDEQPSDLSLDSSRSLSSNPPYISSAVDDIMYIVNQVVERSLATSQQIVISSVVPSVARVLDSDFIGMIQRKMRDESYPKAAVQDAPQATIITFLILINNLDVAIDYVRRIVQSRVEIHPCTGATHEHAGVSSKSLDSLLPFGNDASHARSALKSLQQSFEAKASELISDGIYVVFKNVVKPRLRPLLSDVFRDIDYQMHGPDLEGANRSVDNDEENGEGAEGAVQYHFQRGWEGLNEPIKRILTNHNFERLQSTTMSYLAEVLERRIWSYFGRINDLGAVRLERDIASLINVIVRGGRYGLRDAFVRCTQICLVMNMEEDEWAESQSPASAAVEDGGLEWKLDHEERTRARSIVHSRR
ncbi:MAG: hypothetical protein LQ348_006074 [Seirophora lacunosa]|nr:MAG: hypothetical protein LQ348_006074 [Seirophora lacunosa]